jgi:molybdopterin molybdotransferase
MRTETGYPLLSVEEAERRVLAAVAPLAPVTVPILAALDQVLAEDISAPFDVPPHANSAMDGYAVRYRDLAPGCELPVVGYLAAGHAWGQPLAKGTALRIMTGAPLPEGADTVVRFEDTTSLDNLVRIAVVPKLGRNVRLAGEDVRSGQLVLPAGRLLRPQEIGMLASLGRAEVRVHGRPVVAILSTGDEVAPVGAPLPPGCIYDINSYTVAAQVARAGGEPLLLAPAPDRQEALSARLQTALTQADLIVTSGGVSVGDFDLVKNVLTTEGQMDFWWVNMKPGKPLAFGRLANVPLLALPGNPVAAMLAFHLFGRPAVLKMRGLTSWAAPTVLATLADALERKDGRRHYLRVRLQAEGDGWIARLTGDQGSGILSSLTAGQGVAIIPEDCERLPAGSRVQVVLLD